MKNNIFVLPPIPPQDDIEKRTRWVIDQIRLIHKTCRESGQGDLFGAMLALLNCLDVAIWEEGNK